MIEGLARGKGVQHCHRLPWALRVSLVGVQALGLGLAVGVWRGRVVLGMWWWSCGRGKGEGGRGRGSGEAGWRELGFSRLRGARRGPHTGYYTARQQRMIVAK